MDPEGSTRLPQLLDAVLAIGADLDLPSMLQRIIEAAVELVDARYGALGVLDETGTRLSEFITVGIDEEGRRSIGNLPEGHGILGLLIVDAKPLRLRDLTQHADSFGFPPNHPPMRSFLGVPILLRDEVFGNLYLTDNTGAEVFTEVDEELVIGLASAAGVAIENARLHAKVQELALLEDRERIARDLHDTVIQRLFATGMSLQGTVRLVEAEPAEAIERIEGAIDDLDTTVKHIRTAIFGLSRPRAAGATVRSRLLSVAHGAAGALGYEPRVLFDGPIDTAVGDELGAELLAVVREALSNVARHARSSSTEVSLTVTASEVCLEVSDDGVGPPAPDAPRGHGLHNLEERARRLQGTFELLPREGGGTIARWCAPRP